MTTPANLQADAAVADAANQPGERALIAHIRRRLPTPPPSLVVGIGDDAAIATASGRELQVLTTDALVEGVHFDRRYSTPADIGFKALAVNVSDVAAMGAAPRYALLSLILPSSMALPEIDGLLDGLLELADRTGVTLAGGNITRTTGPLVVDVSLIGAVRPRRYLTRGGARPGDHLYVSGAIGGAAAGLGWLTANADRGLELPDDLDVADCVTRHRRPEPRARLGALLGRSKAATACMDSSDGLADAVRQIAEASGTGAKVSAAALPLHPGAASWFARRGEDPIASSISASDDYELVFTVSNRARGRLRHVIQQARGLPITKIGELTAESTFSLQREGGIEPLPAGFVHF